MPDPQHSEQSSQSKRQPRHPAHLDDRYAWVVPPQRGYQSVDLDRIPTLRRHTELIDGSLVVPAAQTVAHWKAVDLLWAGLDRQAPEGFWAMGQMTVTLAPRQRPEPDIAVLCCEEEPGPDETDLDVAGVVLVVEVVSAESAIRDRERKPQLYAQAGIPHFWLVEGAGEGRAFVVHVYELDEFAGAYELRGVHRGRLRLDVPFPIDIKLKYVEPPVQD